MDYSVVVTDGFAQRFDDALAFREQYYGASSARRLLDAYDRMCEVLGTTPRIGRAVRDYPDEPPPAAFRWIRADQYIIVYQVDDDARRVALLDIFHRTSDWRKRVSG